MAPIKLRKAAVSGSFTDVDMLIFVKSKHVHIVKNMSV